MNDPSQLQGFSQDADLGSYSRLRPKLAAAHHVVWVVVLLTSGIVALALGHFEVGLAAVLLSTPSVILGLRAWLRNGRSRTTSDRTRPDTGSTDAAYGSFEVGDHYRQPD